MSILRTIVCLAGAVAALRAQNPPLAVEDLPVTREGSYWVRTTQEITVKPPQPRLIISTRGKITLRGGSGDKITWKLKQRVRATTEGIARRWMGDISVEGFAISNQTHLVIMPTPSLQVINELEVTVPRHMEKVDLQTQSGGIEAYDVDGDVVANAISGSIELAGIGGNVLGAYTGGGSIHLGKIGGFVQHCRTEAGPVIMDNPSRAANCVTAGGDITVAEAGGQLDLSTGGGNIHVGKAAGSVNVASAAGLIDIGQAGGTVIADARGGSIRIASAHGLQAASAQGMVTVKAVSGPMSVSTAMGNIMAELMAGARLEDSSLVAGSGDITVWIPSNFPVSLVWPGTSRVRSDFPELQTNSTALFRPPVLVQGALNGGGPVIRLNTAGGTIYVRRVR